MHDVPPTSTPPRWSLTASIQLFHTPAQGQFCVSGACVLRVAMSHHHGRRRHGPRGTLKRTQWVVEIERTYARVEHHQQHDLYETPDQKLRKSIIHYGEVVRISWAYACPLLNSPSLTLPATIGSFARTTSP